MPEFCPFWAISGVALGLFLAMIVRLFEEKS